MGLFKKFRKSEDKKIKPSLKLEDSLIHDLQSPDKQVRMKALSKIEDDDVLLDFALNDPDIEVRTKAVELIGDEDILTDIAWGNPNSRLRVAAISNPSLSDERLFLDLADDSNKDVRIAAINRIDDEDVLLDIADRQSNKEVKKIALARIRK